MKRSWKAFFKRASRAKGSVSGPSSHPETRPGPAQLLGQRKTPEQESGTDQPQGRSSLTQSSEPESHHGSSKRTSRRPSAQQPINPNGEHSIGATDYALPPQDVPEEVEGSIADDSIADNYRAYLPAAASDAVSPGSKTSTTDADFFSLGGDSRLAIGRSEMKHGEDVADRNIDQYGSKSASRHSSLGSHQPNNQIAQDRQLRRKSVATSIESLGSPDSVGGSLSSVTQKYTLGTGIATEGSLQDGILPHVKDPNAAPYHRKDWPTRVARDDVHLNAPRRRRGSKETDMPNIRRESFGRRNEMSGKERNFGTMDLRHAIMNGPEDYKNDVRANLDGVVDVRDTEDADKDTRYAPEVVHEVVKPHQHEIIEERIYREIHNHDVYHYVQPVYETEILPARHWVYNSNNELVEVTADKLPECTGANQRWSIVRGDREKPNTHVVRSSPQVREPRIISDKTYMTLEGFERRETTILHPPELADMSNYDGPVVPIEFLHHPVQAPKRELKTTEKGLDHLPNGGRFTMDELSDVLLVARTLTNGSASSASRPRTGSSSSTSYSKRLPIPRKPISVVGR